jgi:hypothetical protein
VEGGDGLKGGVEGGEDEWTRRGVKERSGGRRGVKEWRVKERSGGPATR